MKTVFHLRKEKSFWQSLMTDGLPRSSVVFVFLISLVVLGGSLLYTKIQQDSLQHQLDQLRTDLLSKPIGQGGVYHNKDVVAVHVFDFRHIKMLIPSGWHPDYAESDRVIFSDARGYEVANISCNFSIEDFDEWTFSIEERNILYEDGDHNVRFLSGERILGDGSTDRMYLIRVAGQNHDDCTLVSTEIDYQTARDIYLGIHL